MFLLRKILPKFMFPIWGKISFLLDFSDNWNYDALSMKNWKLQFKIVNLKNEVKYKFILHLKYEGKHFFLKNRGIMCKRLWPKVHFDLGQFSMNNFLTISPWITLNLLEVTSPPWFPKVHYICNQNYIF